MVVCLKVQSYFLVILFIIILININEFLNTKLIVSIVIVILYKIYKFLILYSNIYIKALNIKKNTTIYYNLHRLYVITMDKIVLI